MKRVLYTLIAATLTSLSIQAQDFTVQFIPPSDLSVTKYYLDRVKEDKLVRDSALLQDGVVTFTGKTDHPIKSRVVLFLKPKEGERPDVKFVDVVLEPATIKVDASKGLDNISYSGTKTQQEFQSYKMALNPVYKAINEKWAGIYKAGKDGDKETENKLRAEAKVLSEEVKMIQENFMDRNSTSVVTALMLKDYVTPVWENLDKAQQYFNRLSPQQKALPGMVEFAKGLSIASSMSVGKKYPELILPDSTGKMISVASYQGKYVFVDFWASWCTPCRAESPALVSAYKKYKDKGFEILSVSFDQNRDAWLKAVAKDGYTWANIIDSTGMGPGGVVSSRLDIKAIPRNFLLDKEGKVIATNLRGEALENKLKELFGS